jgi:hypothetical protein
MRWSGWRLPPASTFSGELSRAAARGVLVSEGAMQFTRTPVPAMFVAGSDRSGTERELRETFEAYFSWFGRYTVDPARGIITHRIEGSLWPSWRNTVQERPFVIRGDTMLLGDLVRAPDGTVRRTRGIVHTIKDGIVIENANLMRDVERMVRDAKKAMPMDVVREPWVTSPPQD